MPQPMPITIRGKTYSSNAEAARDLGVSAALVTYYKNRGRLDEIGLFDPLHDGKKVPVTIRGIRYESYTAAAKDLGVSVGQITRAVARGKLDDVGNADVLD